MRRHFVMVAAMFLFGISAAAAQATPSATRLADDLNPPLQDGTAIDFAFRYDVHLFDGADPEGDATLTIKARVRP